METTLLIAVLNAIGRIGLQATLAIIQSRMATVDDAIAALAKARDVSLQDNIDQDAALRALSPPSVLDPPSPT